MVLARLVQQLREHQQRHVATVQRLRRAYQQSERLRAELSHLEHEIYELWASDLPRPQKRFLEEILRVRCCKVQGEMAELQAELQHSGHHIWSGGYPCEGIR